MSATLRADARSVVLSAARSSVSPHQEKAKPTTHPEAPTKRSKARRALTSPFSFITHGGDDELDMTPMVDVTFLLLIFFMITAAFALQKSIEVPPTDDQEAAQAQTEEDFEEGSIIIRVDSDNSYWIGCPAWTTEQEAMSKPDMLLKLREARKTSVGGDAGPC